MNLKSKQLRERAVFPLEKGVESLLLLEGGEAKGAHWAVVVPAGERASVIEALSRGETPKVHAAITCVKEGGGIAFYLVGLCRFIRQAGDKILRWNASVAFEEPESAPDVTVACRTLSGEVVERDITVKGVIFRQNGREVFRGNLTNYFGVSNGTISENGREYSVIDKSGSRVSGSAVAFLTDNEMRTFGHVAVVEVGESSGQPPLLLEAIGDIIPLVEKLQQLQK